MCDTRERQSIPIIKFCRGCGEIRDPQFPDAHDGHEDDLHPETCECIMCEQERDPAYLAYMANIALDEKLGRKCPKCGERALKEHVTPTRNYGGGFDTFEECAKCDYQEVYV